MRGVEQQRRDKACNASRDRKRTARDASGSAILFSGNKLRLSGLCRRAHRVFIPTRKARAKKNSARGKNSPRLGKTCHLKRLQTHARGTKVRRAS